MRRARAWRAALYLVATCVLAGCAQESDLVDEPLKPNLAQVLAEADLATPTDESPWLPAPVPDWRPGKPLVWYRVVFDAPQKRSEAWALYLPYLYGGGKVVLNGVDLEQIGSLASGLWVRWERPHLVVLPDALVRTGRNVLLLRVERSPIGNSPVLAPLEIGRRSVLQARFDRRLFIVTTLPQFTVIACAVTAVFMFFIFWRRRSEVLFGLFGLAVLMWGARTLTFVIEVLPAAWWPAWRTVYFASTGGFVIALMLFTMRMAGRTYPRVEFALLAYWALGPLIYLLTGNEALLATYWVGGLVPVGIALGVFAALGAFQQRSGATIAVALALGIGVLCGVHDYWLAVGSSKLLEWMPVWAEQRLFALHHGANLMLLMMGTVLSGRFLGALHQVEDVNRTLEARIAAREQELDASYRSLAALQRVQAAADERVGAEVAESQDNPTYTRGLLWTFAQPHFHTGLRASFELLPELTLAAMVVNGWDRSVDNNVGKTFGLGLRVNPSDAFSASLAYIGGPEQTDTTEVSCAAGTAYDPAQGTCAQQAGAPAQTQVVDRGGANDFDAFRHLIDLTLSLEPTESLSLVLNADYGVEGVRPVDTSIEATTVTQKWYGASLVGRMQLNETWAVALRGEYFKDADGRVFEYPLPGTTAEEGKVLDDVELASGTLTVEARPTENLILRLENRGDFALGASPDKNIFREKVRDTSDKAFTTTLGVVVTTN